LGVEGGRGWRMPTECGKSCSSRETTSDAAPRMPLCVR